MNQELKIEWMCEQLREIADCIGPGTAYNRLLPSPATPVPLALPMHRAARLVPPVWLLTEPDELVRESHVLVEVPRLFEQIEFHSNVIVALTTVISALPLTVVGPPPLGAEDRTVEIPLRWVTEALRDDDDSRCSRLAWTG